MMYLKKILMNHLQCEKCGQLPVEVQWLGLAFHLSKQRPHFSSHMARCMYRDEAVGQPWSTTFTYGRAGHSRKLASPGKFTDVK